jgi:hypothetical protein
MKFKILLLGVAFVSGCFLSQTAAVQDRFCKKRHRNWWYLLYSIVRKLCPNCQMKGQGLLANKISIMMFWHDKTGRRRSKDYYFDINSFLHGKWVRYWFSKHLFDCPYFLIKQLMCWIKLTINRKWRNVVDQKNLWLRPLDIGVKSMNNSWNRTDAPELYLIKLHCDTSILLQSTSQTRENSICFLFAMLLLGLTPV